MRRPYRGTHVISTAGAWAPALFISLQSILVGAETFPFDWWFDQQNDYTIPSCDIVNFGFGVDTNSSVAPAPPYSLIVHLSGGIPSVFQATGPTANESWQWTVAYPPGAQLLMAFIDSNGNSGGVSQLYSIVGSSPGNNINSSCVMYGQQSSPVSFTLSNSQPMTCENVTVNVKGGQPPYTLTQVVSGDTFFNSSFGTTSGSFTNKLTAGATFMVSLSDSKGQYANTTQLLSSGGGQNTSCLSGRSPLSTSKSHTTEIIGIVVALVAVAAAVAGFFWYRRRIQRHQKELAATRTSSIPGSGPDGFDGGFIDTTLRNNGQEKPISPMNAANGNGDWRPESPVEYQGVGGIPGRFRVTNPDEDSRSSFSATGSGSFRRDRESADTVRMGSYRSNGGAQRRSLLAEDYNVLYPPTSSGSNTPNNSRPAGRQRKGTWSSKTSEHDAAWPTSMSSASSATDDHYMDQPASSSGILSKDSNRNSEASGGSGTNGSRYSGSQWRQVQSDDLDREAMYEEEGGGLTPTSEMYADDMGSSMRFANDSTRQDLSPTFANRRTIALPGHIPRKASTSSQDGESPFTDSARVEHRLPDEP